MNGKGRQWVFWSSIGGFLGSVGSGIGSVARGVVGGISRAFSWAKEKAAQACDWIAEKGERFIDNVKEVYQKVKPFLQMAKPWIDTVARAISPYFPWVSAAITVVGEVIDGLLTLENSPVAKKVEQGLRWVIKVAQFIRERYLNKKEMEEAEEHQREFNEFLESEYARRLSLEQRQAIELQQMLNNYALVKTRLRDILEMGVPDFQAYLRLRAVQQLLDNAEKQLNEAQHISDILDDDKFLVNIAEQMLSTTELSGSDAQRLDKIVKQRFGTSLLPFVFNELLKVWFVKYIDLEKEWKEISAEVSKLKVQRTRLETNKKISGLTEQETKEYHDICAKFAGQETKLKRTGKERLSMKNYLFAAEGFMQILEKSEEELIAEDKDYLLEDTTEVASIIMRVAQNNIDWDSLEKEEQSIINDYSLIFQKEGRERMERLLKEIEVKIGV